MALFLYIHIHYIIYYFILIYTLCIYYIYTGIAGKIAEAEKNELVSLIDESLDWLEENPEADADEYKAKQKEVEQVANPIMRKVYGSSGSPGGSGGGDEDFGDDEL